MFPEIGCLDQLLVADRGQEGLRLRRVIQQRGKELGIRGARHPLHGKRHVGKAGAQGVRQRGVLQAVRLFLFPVAQLRALAGIPGELRDLHGLQVEGQRAFRRGRGRGKIAERLGDLRLGGNRVLGPQLLKIGQDRVRIHLRPALGQEDGAECEGKKGGNAGTASGIRARERAKNPVPNGAPPLPPPRSRALLGNFAMPSPSRFSLLTGGRRARCGLLGLACAFYFGSLLLAAFLFPKAYDWRANVISNLLSPRDNPRYYWLPAAGVALAGLCMLPLLLWIETHLERSKGWLARWVRKPGFVAGAGCLVLAAIVVPQHTHPVLGLRRLHETLARAAAAGLILGMLCSCWSLSLLARAAPPAARRRLRALSAAWNLLIALPIAALLASTLLLLAAKAAWIPGAASLAHALRGTIWWRLAFWEWFGSAVVFFFLASSVLWLAPELAQEKGRA